MNWNFKLFNLLVTYAVKTISQKAVWEMKY